MAVGTGAAGWAAEAERSVLTRHVRPLWGLPGTALGAVRAPAPPATGFGRWHYWWQAHLLDCALDAVEREPTADRRRLVATLVRSIRLRNLGWCNNYYDDMAWLALALHRADSVAGVRRPAAVARLTTTLRRAWSDEAGGGIPWRRGDDFRNVPANGPAAILLARTGHLDEATATVDWIARRLMDPVTGLALDGLRPGSPGSPGSTGSTVEAAVYTYNQGTVLGAGTELAVRTGAPRHGERVRELVDAVAAHLTTDGVLRTHGGGDGGLFTGILVRYLALAATHLPGHERTRALAYRLVLDSAADVWAHRVDTAQGPVLGRAQTADLSVQLGGWMVLEAAARLGR